MNYDNYHLAAREWMICIGEYIIIISLFSYLFYDSMLFALALLPFFVLYVKCFKEKRKAKRREELKEEFLKSLQSVSTSLVAGLSPENAFRDALSDMKRLYGERGYIVVELEAICRKITYGTRLEDALADFANRSAVETIRDFSVVFGAAKKSGGGFSHIISDCIDIMDEDRKTKEEAMVLIRSKQYEQQIMNIVPLGIILYLKLSSGDFINVLYHNLAGYVIMSGCVFTYVFSVFISERISRINI